MYGAVHKVRHAIFTPSLCHTLSHIPGPSKSTSHISDPHTIFLVGLVQKPDKGPLRKFSQLFAGFLSGRVCQGVFGLEGFVRSGFCPFLLLSQYICYNRKLNITLNFMFNMYDKKCISMTSHALDPHHPVTNCHTYSYPLPSSVTYFMEGPYALQR